MATMTIRNIDDSLKQRLRVRAAQHGRSMEDEARDILRSSLSSLPARRAGLVQSIRARIEPLGGVELDLPRRELTRVPPGMGT
jgi:plasmid stability protein